MTDGDRIGDVTCTQTQVNKMPVETGGFHQEAGNLAQTFLAASMCLPNGLIITCRCSHVIQSHMRLFIN